MNSDCATETGTLCIAGACTPGNCTADAQCATGQICGLSTPYFCGGCTSDAQCQADTTTYGSTYVCNTTSNTCVLDTCTSAVSGMKSVQCTTNPSDVCCANTCVPGSCCAASDCTGSLGNSATCVNHTCTTCNAVGASKIYLVDPLNGSDATATGSGTAGSPAVAVATCAFKTITRALEAIGPSPAAGTIIQVLNDATVGTGETFPIVVTAGVTITGVTTGTTTTTVHVPANKAGFELAAANAGLSTLLVDGTNQTGTTGVVVTAGSAATTTIMGVTVQNMAGDGIDVVKTGIVTLGSGTISQTNGTTAVPRSGLRVTGTGQAFINAPAAFNENTEHGIVVLQSGAVTIAGSATSLVVANANHIANLYINQTPVAGMATPQNSATYFQATNSVTTHGIHLLGGSTLKLRSSITGGNKLDGVFVTTSGQGATKNDSVAGFDLGSVNGVTTSYGDNTLQYASGGTFNPNGGVGLCLNVTANAAQTLQAAGNTFELVDCSAATPAAIKHSATCAGGDDVGVTGVNTTNKIVLSNCN